jgi:hypothetical protein
MEYVIACTEHIHVGLPTSLQVSEIEGSSDISKTEIHQSHIRIHLLTSRDTSAHFF